VAEFAYTPNQLKILHDWEIVITPDSAEKIGLEEDGLIAVG
jgi:hypothetical protein